MFEKIVTLSLNPAIDATLWVDEFKLEQDNLVNAERYDAAGKAMNVSRALHFYNAQNTAIVVAGRHNLEKYERQLRAEKINYQLITQDGFIRENISIIQANKTLTRILRPGFSIESETVSIIKERLSNEVDDKTLVVISGTLPKGITVRVLRNICAHIKTLGGLISLDTSSVTLDDIKEIQPFIIKPNYDEACALFDKKLESKEDILELAQLINSYGVEHVLISLSSDGMLYSNAANTQRYHVSVPSVKLISSVGAGDFGLAGFIMSLYHKHPIEKCISFAAAMGTATCLTDCTFPPQRLVTAKILQEIKLKEL